MTTSTIGAYFGNITPAPLDKFDKLMKDYITYARLGKSVEKDAQQYSTIFNIPTMLGVEIEVEGMVKEVSIPGFWIQEADGSLRMNGKEFKNIPLTPQQTIYALLLLWKIFDKTTASPQFTWRTSNHLHISVQELKEPELKRLILLSMIFEPTLFEFVGQEREQSPYCVPLTRSTLVGLLRNYIVGAIPLKKFQLTWNSGGGEHGNGLYKYSSVNFARLKDLGTVEFRHLGGTKNVHFLCQWISILLQLYKMAILYTDVELIKAITETHTSEALLKFKKHVFGSTYIHLPFPANLQDNFSALMTVKELLATPPKYPGCASHSSLMSHVKQSVKKEISKKGGAKLPPKK